MSTDTAANMSSLETWPLDLADFALVSKEGVVLHCHKARLVENSEYFKAMLSHKVRETDANQMVVPDYDAVTVASFLEWIYAAKLGEDTVKKLKQVAEPGEFISLRLFDQKKFSPELLKMSHLYRMPDLHSDCEVYLEQTVSKENAVEAWKAAGTLGSQKLREKALTTMARNHTEGVEIPGLKDQAVGLEEMMDWVGRHTTIKEEETDEIYFPGADQYHVYVRFNSEIMTFYVNPDDTYESLKTKVESRIYHSKFLLYGEEMRDGTALSHFYNYSYHPSHLPSYTHLTLKRWGIKNGELLYVHLF